MKTSVPEYIRHMSRFGAAGIFVLFCIFQTPQSLATDIHAEWSNAHIAALFPQPMDGWAIGELELEERETITSGFEAYLAGMSGTDVGVSIRLKATRRYESGERFILVVADTSDIEAAANVDAIAAANNANEELRGALEASGMISISHQGYIGVSAQENDKAGRVFKVGSAGIVSMECDYADCARDLATMTERLNLSTFAEFASFDHRK